MSDLIENLITKVIVREGGLRYENVSGDRGGPTKAGITIGRLRTERGRHMTADDVAALTEDDVRAIYKSAYFTRPKIDQLPESIIEFAFDWYVTSGTWAVKGLQDLLNDAGFGLPVDGVLGADTLDAAHAAAQGMGDDLLRAYVIERTHFFGRIVDNDESQGKFLRGWINGRSKPFWKG
jgi:lysozyme family protein